jgi:hypothetical protein
VQREEDSGVVHLLAAELCDISGNLGMALEIHRAALSRADQIRRPDYRRP